MAKVGLFSKLVFSQVSPLIKLGTQKVLTASDMPELDPRLRVSQTEKLFDPLLAKLSDPHKKLSEWRFVWLAFWNSGSVGKKIMGLGLLRLPIELAAPLLLHRLLESIQVYNPQTHTPQEWKIWALGIGLGFCVVLNGIVVQHFFYFALMKFAQIVSGLSTVVYRASLRLSRKALLKTSTGDLINHMASDCEGIAESAFFVSETLNAVVLVSLSLVMLVQILGPAGWIAILTAVVVSPFLRFFGRKLQTTDSELWDHRDHRVTLMSQILGSIRVVKAFSWERSMEKEVGEVRAKELGSILKIVKQEALSTVFTLGSSLLVSVVGFYFYVRWGGTLTASVVFPCIMIFQQLDHPLGHLSHWLKDMIHARVAAERLMTYFSQERLPESGSQGVAPKPIYVNSLSVQFDRPVISNLSIEIKPQESLAIIGKVGSGKTTFIQALMGEIPEAESSIRFERPAYMGWAPQEAYVLNATLKENIALGAESDLKGILHDCALLEDLHALPAGIETEIGERGITISGGQKQRVSLARIAALDPPIVFLDDPLSAVDSHTEKLLVDRLLFGRWKDKTRIMATHRLDYLDRFDRILFLKPDGTSEIGTYSDLKARSQDFKQFLLDHTKALGEPKPDEERTLPGLQINPKEVRESGQLVAEEERDQGKVKSKFFFEYFMLLGGDDTDKRWSRILKLAGMMGLTILSIVLPMVQSRWLGAWADSGGTMFGITSPAAIAIYTAVGCLALFVVNAERVAWMKAAILAGGFIHQKALRSVLHAPVRFFDTTPMGRILNRFSRDMKGIDDELSWNFRGAIQSFLSMFATLLLILYYTPFVIIAIVPAFVLFYFIQRDYRSAAREAKRLESISRSPRYAHFKETLLGLPVIRALGVQDRFFSQFVGHLEEYTRQYWASIMINRWFSTRAPIISGMVGLGTSCVVIYSVIHSQMSPGVAGLVLTFAMSFWGQLNWCVRAFSEVESRMTGYERVRAYSHLEPEPDPSVSDREEKSIPEGWPDRGEIKFDKVWARYAPHLPDILKGVDLTIPAKSKIGIVGRTGSGKSSLVQALYRFFEIRKGDILIDGVSIKKVPKKRLRRSFSIIPQDPVLFLGTIRSNLDRFSQSTDEQVWEAIDRVSLRSLIEKVGGLKAEVSENGLNFSQGQRQLLCLARALLQKSRIIIMDEATASIDVSTDATIQETIRTQFSHATVLTIAHRMGSVTDSDYILNMDQGEGTLRNTH